MEGWIKIHRKLLDWEWYSDINVTRLFIHLLLKANHTENKWQGMIIEQGQLVTSLEHLSKEIGLTFQQTRTALDKLKSTNEITIKTTNKNSLITIMNYSFYQNNETKITSEITNKITNEQQTNNKQNNKQITTNKNDKNIFNYFISNYIVKLDGKDFGEKIKIKGQMRRDPKWIELNDVEQMDLIGR